MSARTRNSVADPASHRAGVAAFADRFVIVAIRWGRLGANVPNAFVAEQVSAYGGRAIGLACVDPHDPSAPSELELAVTRLGLRGLKLSPVYQGFHPWAPEAWRLYELANALRIPIMFHQGAAFPAQAQLENGDPVLLDKVARAFPELRIIIAHLGQPWIPQTVQLLRKHPQLLSDLSARSYRRWELYNALMLAVDYGVTDQLLFGSDFPMQTTAEAAAALRAINDWGPGVTLPQVPERVIEGILTERPLTLVWP